MDTRDYMDNGILIRIEDDGFLVTTVTQREPRRPTEREQIIAAREEYASLHQKLLDEQTEKRRLRRVCDWQGWAIVLLATVVVAMAGWGWR